jgi:hypothetical protein
MREMEEYLRFPETGKTAGRYTEAKRLPMEAAR